MNLTRVVFKSHKWLAVTAGSMTFLWFFSGIFLVLPNRLLHILSSVGPAPAPKNREAHDFRALRVSIPEAIAAVDRAAGRTVLVQGVEMRKIEGQVYYRLAADDATHLVNAQDGSLLEISEEVARRILVHEGIAAASLGSASRVETYGAEYTYGPLPAWRIESRDAHRTIYYVEVHGGTVRASHRLGRVREYLEGLHTLTFLRPWLSSGALRLVLWIFSIIGTVMTVFGFWILGMQYRNWRERRTG
jgi:hypothetical protein